MTVHSWCRQLAVRQHRRRAGGPPREQREVGSPPAEMLVDTYRSDPRRSRGDATLSRSRRCALPSEPGRDVDNLDRHILDQADPRGECAVGVKEGAW